MYLERSKWIFKSDGIQTESSEERTPNSSQYNVNYESPTDERKNPTLASVLKETTEGRTTRLNECQRLPD